MKSTHAKKSRPTFSQFVQGIQARAAFLQRKGIDLTAPPARRYNKGNTYLPEVKVDVEEDLVAAALTE